MGSPVKIMVNRIQPYEFKSTESDLPLFVKDYLKMNGVMDDFPICMRTFFKFVLILSILASGVLIAKVLIATKPIAERKPISIGAPVVELVRVRPQQEQIYIHAMGTVISANEVQLQPQVSGHIVEINPKLIPGGRFKAGERILRIDDQDYKIIVDQRKAEVTKAVLDLKTEKNMQAIARREWELLESEASATQEGRELALRKPQLKNARASLESARSRLKQAWLDVERTNIKSPFNALVKEKLIDIGQFVGAGTQLTTLVGTDAFWVQISVPVKHLSWISIPGVNAEKGSPARVIQESTGTSSDVVRQAIVIRLLGDLDPAGRMARILLSVDDPLALKHEEKTRGIPLLLGAYVQVEIQGPLLEDIFIIPQKAFRETGQVWLLAEDKTLSIKKIELIWRRKEDVLVRGLKSGDQLITSRIPAPVPGMALRNE